ncbi:hypothetical protein PanWU01x14_185120 [Parasponia andersonii]|uniref:LRR domain containing protein n=1 Tax=Parasponia andersonii TaxID=3476 RepID=A0A2P5C4C1_PARAD|nr:hypothetical protein PanWU01x14_185120 [Parasponia andersonii]
MRTQKGIECLENFRILSSVNAQHHGLDLVKELEMLRQLRWLTLSHLTAEKGRALCLSISRADLRVKEYAKLVIKAQNLLGLNLSRLLDDPLKNLKALSSLNYLWLEQAYEGEELQFEEALCIGSCPTAEDNLWLATPEKPQTRRDFGHAKGIFAWFKTRRGSTTMES